MAGYGDDPGFQAWLTANGYDLPADGLAPAVLRQRGSVYLDGLYEAKLPGVRTGGFAQERAQPRTGGTFNGAEIPSDVVPPAWVYASYFAAYQEAISPGSLSIVAVATEAVKREKIGGMETEYFEGSADVVKNATPLLSAIEGLVAPFLTQLFPAALLV